MAILNGQQINLQNAGLLSAMNRKLSGGTGTVDEEDQQGGGANLSALNPFQNYAIAPNAPTQAAPQVSLKQFSFNPKYAGISAGFERQASDLGLQRNNAITAADDVYRTQLGDANRQQSDAVRKLQERLAIRGLGSSSVLINERGNQEQAFQRYVDNLGRVRGNNIAQAEQGYAGGLEDINRSREGLYFQQVQEEEQLARQRAEQEAQNQFRAEQMRMQQEYQMQQQQAQAQAMQQQQAMAAQQQQALMRAIGGVGGGGGGGAPAAAPQGQQYGLENGQMVGKDAFMWAIQNTPNQAWLNWLWDDPAQYGLGNDIRQAVLGRIAGPRGWTGGNMAAL